MKQRGRDTVERSWIRSAPLEETEEPVPEIGLADALLIAAACAKGESIINSCEVIYRGYEKLTEKLSSLGCDIEEI